MSLEQSKGKVSIITATYKKFDMLFDTIKSVLDQDYSQIEYIICDDCSDAFPEKEIQDYISNNKKNNLVTFKIIHHDQNMGTVKNLNSAIQESTGEYIFMLSCNDVFANKSVVSNIMDCFKKNKCDLIVTSRLLVDDKGKGICVLPHLRERKKILKCNSNIDQYRLYISGKLFDMASGSAMYYSRKILDEFGLFDVNYRLLEDAPFIERFLWKYKLYPYYEMISINYQDGGVSSKNVKKEAVNTMFSKDMDLFKFKQRFNHFKELDSKSRRILTYSKKLYEAKGLKNKMKVYLRYPDQALSFGINRELKKIYRKYESIVIGIKKN